MDKAFIYQNYGHWSKDKFDEVKQFFDRIIKKIKIHFSENKISHFIPRQGDIYYMQLGKNISTELNKQRPCVVWSIKNYNAGGNIIILPLKTWRKDGDKKFSLNILPSDSNGLRNKSILVVSDIRSLSKKRCGGKIGHIDNFYKERIHDKVLDIFGVKQKPLDHYGSRGGGAHLGNQE